MRAFAANAALRRSAASTSSTSRCCIAAPSPFSLHAPDARRSRSGASASPSGTSIRSTVSASRSSEAGVVQDRTSSLVEFDAAVSPPTSSSSFAPPTAALVSLLLLVIAAAVASPEASAAAVTETAAAAATSPPQLVATLADLDPSTAATLASLLRPFFSVAELFFIVRIVLTWYPAVDGDKLPWAVVIKPTEPFLVGTRKVVPPLAGVDVSPVVWVALLSFVSEILVGPQGILILLSRKVGA